MCGIVGASSKEIIDLSAIKLSMLHADERGGDSCGIALRGEKPYIIRQLARAKTFINDKHDDVKFPKQNNTFIGHTRYATEGDVNYENAHPFIFGDIVGVHNGSIENFDALKKKYIDDYRKDIDQWYSGDWKEGLEVNNRKEIELESDSRLLYYLIWKKGLKKTLPELKGTMALAFFKKEENQEYIYLYRYDKPLCYGYRDNELWIGTFKSYLDSLGCNNIKKLTEHAIYKIKDGKIIVSKQVKQDLKPEEKSSYKNDFDPELEPEKKKYSNNTKYKGAGYTNGYGYVDNDNWRSKFKKDKKDMEKDNNKKEKEECGFRFCAPNHAKAFKAEDDGSLCLFWFSNEDYNFVYIEREGYENVDNYKLNVKDEKEELATCYPAGYDKILEEYEELKEANNLRVDEITKQ